MSRYIPEIRYETTFEDDSVVVTMKPLTRASFVSILPSLENLRTDPENSEKAIAVYDVACNVLKVNLVSLEGLRDANGNAIEAEAFLNETYFMHLVTETFNKLIEGANLGKV